jgi:hypothetical protein
MELKVIYLGARKEGMKTAGSGYLRARVLV